MLVTSDDVLKTIGKKIKSSRLSQKFTQEYVAENIEISIDLLSRKFFANKTTLMHNFKKYTGTSVKAYVLEKRLEDAENWLKISNLTCTEICYRSGFQTPAYFCKYFKSKYGLTPDAYRRKFKKGEQLCKIN